MVYDVANVLKPTEKRTRGYGYKRNYASKLWCADQPRAIGCLKFITGPVVYRPRPVNPITRTDLFWLAHVTQQKRGPALNPLSARIETPHLLATTDAFTATDYRSFIGGRRKRDRDFSYMGPVMCWNKRNRFITFHNVFRHTHFRSNPYGPHQNMLSKSFRLSFQVAYFLIFWGTNDLIII